MRALLDALCDPSRVMIVRALRETTLAARDLAHLIGRNRSVTSQHLRLLRECGAIVAKRKGNVVRCTSSDESGSIVEAAVITTRVHPHAFRSSFATHYVLNGGDSATAQAIMGIRPAQVFNGYVNVALSDVDASHAKALARRADAAPRA